VIGLAGVSAEDFSDTIGAIYDCALDPHAWPGTCRKIAATESRNRIIGSDDAAAAAVCLASRIINGGCHARHCQ